MVGNVQTQRMPPMPSLLGDPLTDRTAGRVPPVGPPANHDKQEEILARMVVTKQHCSLT